MALDYDNYPILGRPPQTMHEHFRVEPLGCESFPEYMRLRLCFAINPQGATSFKNWLDDRIWELLQRPAIRQCRLELSGVWYAADNGPLSAMVRQCTMYDQHLQRRAVLMDGTIVKEWAGASGASTCRSSNLEARAGVKGRGRRKGAGRQG